MDKIPEEQVEYKPERDEMGRLLPGHTANPNGRTKGTRDFATDFDEVVKDIAKENNLTVSDVRKVLLKQAYKQAKNGNYSFYKDIHDRIYGQSKQHLEHSGGIDIIDLTEEEKIELRKLLGK